MSAFKVTPTKKAVNPEALAVFSAGADAHQLVATAKAGTVASETRERQTESLLFRLTKSQLNDFNFVFENTNVKSKQKLLEAIILSEIERRAEALRHGGVA